MAEPVTIARPYAEAVFELAREHGRLSEWSAMLELLAAIAEDPQVRACIGDPKLSAAELDGLILGIAGDRLDGHGRNFAQLLLRNERFSLLPQIRALYEALRREHEGVLEVGIHSARPLSDAQLKELVSRLESKYQRKVSAKITVDPELIGGARIIVGDKVLDGTVRGRLEAMAAALAH